MDIVDLCLLGVFIAVALGVAGVAAWVGLRGASRRSGRRPRPRPPAPFLDVHRTNSSVDR